MIHLTRFFPALLLVILVPFCTFSQEEPFFIVSTSWVADRLSNENLVLLHVGARDQYDSTHLPGAEYISLSEISTPRTPKSILEFPEIDQLVSTFESKGISNRSSIVVYYGKDWISPTARVYLTLDYLGLGDQTAIMDGGMIKWISEGRPVTDRIPTPRPGSIKPHRQNEVIVDLGWVRENLENPEILLIDSRTPPYYSGEKLGNAVRPGHLPGALNIPYNEMVDDQLMFREPDKLRALFSSSGMDDSKTAVSYCHIGQQASMTYFIARYLGFKARMYDGSMNEWTQDPDLPMVMGNP